MYVCFKKDMFRELYLCLHVLQLKVSEFSMNKLICLAYIIIIITI